MELKCVQNLLLVGGQGRKNVPQCIYASTPYKAVHVQGQSIHNYSIIQLCLANFSEGQPEDSLQSKPPKAETISFPKHYSKGFYLVNSLLGMTLSGEHRKCLGEQILQVVIGCSRIGVTKVVKITMQD